MSLQESGEMYLETILQLKQENGNVRSIDVANRMGYSKPSISRAVHSLEANGYVEFDQDGYIVLTDSGKAVAERTLERHSILTALFMKLGVSPETAAEDACRIEHVISEETFAAIKKHSGKVF
ncbi:MAG: metal-dependent transcriptional regulator [Ruminococcaceae bacterium]|nr:metal-dependent transcriptional regulator [Oscillospiraceae bacterium]